MKPNSEKVIQSRLITPNDVLDHAKMLYWPDTSVVSEIPLLKDYIRFLVETHVEHKHRLQITSFLTANFDPSKFKEWAIRNNLLNSQQASYEPPVGFSSFYFNADSITDDFVKQCIQEVFCTGIVTSSNHPNKNLVIDYLTMLAKQIAEEEEVLVLHPDTIFAKFNRDEFKEWVERGQFDDSLKHQNNQEIVSLTFSVDQLQAAVSAYARSRFMSTGPRFMGMPNSNAVYNNSFQSGYQPTYQSQNGFLQCEVLHAYLEMLYVNSSLDEYISKYQSDGAFMLCSKFKPFEFYQWVANMENNKTNRS